MAQLLLRPMCDSHLPFVVTLLAKSAALEWVTQWRDYSNMLLLPMQQLRYRALWRLQCPPRLLLHAHRCRHPFRSPCHAPSCGVAPS